ncbi:MAG: hypothetical protein ACLT90_18220 [Enterococcus raffinosus]
MANQWRSRSKAAIKKYQQNTDELDPLFLINLFTKLSVRQAKNHYFFEDGSLI